MKQQPLPLVGGHHIGPLFVPYKTAAAKARMASSKRYRLLRRRTPTWANKRAICNIYTDSLRATIATGIQHSVDHIVPLHHPLVCGLHVENNLRVIALKANLSRGNNGWWPDAPFEQGALL